MTTTELPITRSMSYSQMRFACQGLPVTIDSEHTLPSRRLGLWVPDRRLILIDSRLTWDAKRCVLVHELMHWSHGDGCYPPLKRQEERRTRRETALFLIDPVMVRLSAEAYEDDPWLMSEDLGVPETVVEDYRNLVLRAV